ncbi:hypothetical protein SAMN02745135_02042 [Caloranaerobacter azorensis DSM 13643]|uniref:Uncharacterized protein n=1 Tax=Caloranaerobacter azorensis DSM 13643 TaxID=1121264 RepID=A0A1M5VPX3_9FIRM|nr:hypothetical protein [Caloranaerobacter azorensis]SHH76973.1 hypothetical protein SAMN02745135_02042 [Caloranaerobacter azorensis DSM 13643]
MTKEIADKVYRLIDRILEYDSTIEITIGNHIFFDCTKIDIILIKLEIL